MNTNAQTTRYLSYPEAERYTGISTMTLRRAVSEGRLHACRPPGQRLVRFDTIDLDAFMHAEAMADEDRDAICCDEEAPRTRPDGQGDP